MFLDEKIHSLHKRYSQQADWTASFRDHLYRKFPKDEKIRILEVGCGTGAVLERVENELSDNCLLLAGVDKEADVLRFCRTQGHKDVIQSFGESLPFQSCSFDLVLCHYFLMWVEDPSVVLREMSRVVKYGGICAAMAEPCYSEMLVSPDDLKLLAWKQINMLRKNGAETDVGKYLGLSFTNAGFRSVVHNRYRSAEHDPDFLTSEIEQLCKDCELTDSRIIIGDGTLYNIPTYYAYAVKSKEDEL